MDDEYVRHLEDQLAALQNAGDRLLANFSQAQPVVTQTRPASPAFLRPTRASSAKISAYSRLRHYSEHPAAFVQPSSRATRPPTPEGQRRLQFAAAVSPLIVSADSRFSACPSPGVAPVGGISFGVGSLGKQGASVAGIGVAGTPRSVTSPYADAPSPEEEGDPSARHSAEFSLRLQSMRERHQQTFTLLETDGGYRKPLGEDSEPEPENSHQSKQEPSPNVRSRSAFTERDPNILSHVANFAADSVKSRAKDSVCVDCEVVADELREERTANSASYFMAEHYRDLQRINKRSKHYPCIPCPFSFETREAVREKTIARRKFEDDMAARLAEETEIVTKTFRARPVPPTTYLNRYDQIVEERELKKHMLKQYATELAFRRSRTPQPFQHAPRRRQSLTAADVHLRYEFQATPPPRTIYEAKYQELKERELHHKDKVRVRAEKRMKYFVKCQEVQSGGIQRRSHSAPPVRQVEEDTAAALPVPPDGITEEANPPKEETQTQKEQKEEPQKELTDSATDVKQKQAMNSRSRSVSPATMRFAGPTFQPRINPGVPDWERCSKHNDMLRRLRSPKSPTKIQEFNFHGKAKGQKLTEEQRRRTLQDMEKDEQKGVENRWPYCSPRLPPQRQEAPKIAKHKQPYKTTIASSLRDLQVLREIVEADQREALRIIDAKERRQKQKEAALRVVPLIDPEEWELRRKMLPKEREKARKLDREKQRRHNRQRHIDEVTRYREEIAQKYRDLEQRDLIFRRKEKAEVETAADTGQQAALRLGLPAKDLKLVSKLVNEDIENDSDIEETTPTAAQGFAASTQSTAFSDMETSGAHPEPERAYSDRFTDEEGTDHEKEKEDEKEEDKDPQSARSQGSDKDRTEEKSHHSDETD